MKKVYYTKEELKKLFESPIWKILHENNEVRRNVKCITFTE